MVEHEYALDTDGNPIHIDDKNCTPHIRNLYFCPECKAEMVVKNQGQIKEHHFAHYNGLGGEGVYQEKE
jgi:competence CoiA-like predicted nuclease